MPYGLSRMPKLNAGNTLACGFGATPPFSFGEFVVGVDFTKKLGFQTGAHDATLLGGSSFDQRELAAILRGKPSVLGHGWA